MPVLHVDEECLRRFYLEINSVSDMVSPRGVSGGDQSEARVAEW